MAEVTIGVVASGFAVASLAIQLIESAQKMHNFWQTMEHATSEVERIKDHLTVLRSILGTILEICEKQPQISCGEAVLKSLEVCKSRMDRLANIVQDMALIKDANASKRHWSTFKATVKKKTIQDIESCLKGDVMLLILALQPFFLHVQRCDATLITASIKQLCTVYDAPDSAQVVVNSGHQLVAATQESYPSPRQLVVRHKKRWSASSLSSHFLIHFGYISLTLQLYLNSDGDFLLDYRRRLKIISPFFAYHIQTSSISRQLNVYPVIPCYSQIFRLCLDGKVEAVKTWFKNGWALPSVTNQHGENLLHVSARYAHAELCNLLLDLGVDGSAYDDRLLTPLEHLANKVGIDFAYPSRVVDTMRALVERGRCQPLLPLTSNAITYYHGPEEGFAWLFRVEYAGVDIEKCDSESWTPLGDATFNFGRRTELGVDNPALGWPSLYLLRAGADPHATSVEGRLTPLDTYLRGCTFNGIDNAGKWLQVLLLAGIDLHKYANTEREFHGAEHLLKVAWDEELRKWIPIRRRVVYRYGEASNELEIWLEDYDALSWFGFGRYDMEIFKVMSNSQSLRRWTEINSKSDQFESEDNWNEGQTLSDASKPLRHGIFPGKWPLYIAISLAIHYIFHVYLRDKEIWEGVKIVIDKRV